jgi:hypothetical protein
MEQELEQELEVLRRKRASKKQITKHQDPAYNSSDSRNSRARSRYGKRKKRRK